MEQHPKEIADFTAWLGPIHHVLEIGVRHGGTIRHWHSIATGKIYGVDYEGKDSLGAETLAIHRELAKELPRYRYVIGDSHIPATHLLIAALIHEPVDLLFLDGDHSYLGVRADFDHYRRYVRPGGVVAFHDIVDSPLIRAAGHGVYRYWAELPEPKVEFSVKGEWGGIGAIRV